MTFDDVPESIRSGQLGAPSNLRRWLHSIADHRRHTVTCDPADVGGTPVNIFVFNVENPFGGDVGLQKVPAVVCRNPFSVSVVPEVKEVKE